MAMSVAYFLFLSFYTVHAPIQPCKRFIKHFREKAKKLPKRKPPFQVREHAGWTKVYQDNPAYASMVRAMDWNVGRLLEKLRELGLEDNTVVIFTSDNGGLSTLFKRGFPTSNMPLRAGKGWCYEGGLRVPLIIKVPGTTRPGSLCDIPVISMDFYPTILELAGLPLLPRQHPDGMSLVPLLEGRKGIKRRPLFWHYPHYHGSAWTPGCAVLMGKWKLVEFFETGEVELYDLEKDPGERKNIAAKYPDKVKELKRLVSRWRKEVGAKLPRKR